jgi:hypothetical protein
MRPSRRSQIPLILIEERLVAAMSPHRATRPLPPDRTGDEARPLRNRTSTGCQVRRSGVFAVTAHGADQGGPRALVRALAALRRHGMRSPMLTGAPPVHQSSRTASDTSATKFRRRIQPRRSCARNRASGGGVRDTRGNARAHQARIVLRARRVDEPVNGVLAYSWGVTLSWAMVCRNVWLTAEPEHVGAF